MMVAQLSLDMARSGSRQWLSAYASYRAAYLELWGEGKSTRVRIQAEIENGDLTLTAKRDFVEELRAQEQQAWLDYQMVLEELR